MRRPGDCRAGGGPHTPFLFLDKYPPGKKSVDHMLIVEFLTRHIWWLLVELYAISVNIPYTLT